MDHVDSPWLVTWLAISTARITPPISNALKTSASGCGPRKNEKTTSTGATNSAICALDPMAMLTARSILFLAATSTATQCSAALPTNATTIAPMKNWLRPTDLAASEIEPTRSSDMTPTAMPATASIDTDRLTLQPWCPGSDRSGLNRSRWVRSENNSPKAYEAIRMT